MLYTYIISLGSNVESTFDSCLPCVSFGSSCMYIEYIIVQKINVGIHRKVVNAKYMKIYKRIWCNTVDGLEGRWFILRQSGNVVGGRLMWKVWKGREEWAKYKFSRTGIEPVTDGYQLYVLYSPPLYQLSYHELCWFKN